VNKNYGIMATTTTKSSKAEIEKQKKELLQLIFAKTNTNYKSLIDNSIKDFIFYNLDVLTPTEKKRFDKLVL